MANIVALTSLKAYREVHAAAIAGNYIAFVLTRTNEEHFEKALNSISNFIDVAQKFTIRELKLFTTVAEVGVVSDFKTTFPTTAHINTTNVALVIAGPSYNYIMGPDVIDKANSHVYYAQYVEDCGGGNNISMNFGYTPERAERERLASMTLSNRLKATTGSGLFGHIFTYGLMGISILFMVLGLVGSFSGLGALTNLMSSGPSTSTLAKACVQQWGYRSYFPEVILSKAKSAKQVRPDTGTQMVYMGNPLWAVAIPLKNPTPGNEVLLCPAMYWNQRKGTWVDANLQ